MKVLISPQNSCVGCDEAITNPICPSCLAKQMREMVSEHNPELAKHIAGTFVEGETHCIQCGRSMGLCAHCFSREIYEIIAEKGPEIASEFIQRFDFELRKPVASF